MSGDAWNTENEEERELPSIQSNISENLECYAQKSRTQCKIIPTRVSQGIASTLEASSYKINKAVTVFRTICVAILQ